MWSIKHNSCAICYVGRTSGWESGRVRVDVLRYKISSNRPNDRTGMCGLGRSEGRRPKRSGRARAPDSPTGGSDGRACWVKVEMDHK
jgi:hypothetical protein